MVHKKKRENMARNFVIERNPLSKSVGGTKRRKKGGGIFWRNVSNGKKNKKIPADYSAGYFEKNK